MCVCFAAVAQDRERAAKGSRKVCIPLFINIYAHENMIRIPCPDSSGARKVRERVA